MLTVFVPAVTPVLPLPLKVFVITAGALRTPLGQVPGGDRAGASLRFFGEVYLGIQLGKDAQGFLTRNGWTLAASRSVCALALFYRDDAGNGTASTGRYNRVRSAYRMPKRIAIVEDEAELAALIEYNLGRNGYRDADAGRRPRAR